MTLRTLIAAGAAGLLLPRMASAQGQQLTPAAVFHDPKTPVMGNPDGDITIADFFDCQYPDCKAAHPDLLDVVASDGNVRLVLKDWPILTASTFAGQSGLGAVNLGAYDDLNNVLMQTTGCLS